MPLIFKATRNDQAVDGVGKQALTWGGTTSSQNSPHNLPGESFRLAGTGVVSGTVDAANFNHDDPFSVTFWMKWGATPTGFCEWIGRRVAGGTSHGWYVGTSTTRTKLTFVLLASSTARIIRETKDALPIGEWLHIAMVYDGSGVAAGCTFYCDGHEIISSVVDDDLAGGSTQESGIDLTLKGRDGTAQNPGHDLTDMDDVRIYNHALSASEVAAIYSESKPTTNWRLDKAIRLQATSGSDDWLGRAWQTMYDTDKRLRLYRSSTEHASDVTGSYHIRFSGDGGLTYSDEDKTLDGVAVAGFPLTTRNSDEQPHDAHALEAPNGDLLVWAAYYSGARHGTRQHRSTDGGATWSDDGQIAIGALDDEINFGGGQAVVYDGKIYGACWIDPTPADSLAPHYTAVIMSDDNGTTWTLLANVTATSDNSGEPGIAHLGGGKFIVVAKDNAGVTKTFERIIYSDGTMDPLSEIQGQVGVLQRPSLHRLQDKATLVIGREKVAGGEQTVIYLRQDGSPTWTQKHTLDRDVFEDAGYAGVLVDGDKVNIVSYAGTDDKAWLTEFGVTHTGAISTAASTAPTAAEIRQELDDNSTKLANLDQPISDAQTLTTAEQDAIALKASNNITTHSTYAGLTNNATLARAAADKLELMVDNTDPLAPVWTAAAVRLPTGKTEVAAAGTTAKDLDATGGASETPIDEQPVSRSKTITVVDTADGWVGECSVSVNDGVSNLIAVDFANALPNNARISTVTAVEQTTTDLGTITAGKSRSKAKLSFTPTGTGTKTVKVTATRQGSTSQTEATITFKVN